MGASGRLVVQPIQRVGDRASDGGSEWASGWSLWDRFDRRSLGQTDRQLDRQTNRQLKNFELNSLSFWKMQSRENRFDLPLLGHSIKSNVKGRRGTIPIRGFIYEILRLTNAKLLIYVSLH